MASKKVDVRVSDKAVKDAGLDSNEIFIDLFELSTAEFRELVELDGGDLTTKRSDELLAKTIGLKPAQVPKIPYPDFRAISRTFWVKARALSKEEGEESGDPT